MSKRDDKAKYDPWIMMYTLKTIVVQIYDDPQMGNGEIKNVAEILGISALKVRKILISAGRYSTPTSEEVNRLYLEGKSAEEIQEITGLSRSSVNGYLPYAKGAYNAKLSSGDAQRMKVYRKRQECVEQLCSERSEDALWDVVVAFQEYPFRTMSGLPFSYQLKQGRDGSLNKELLVNRRKESKTLAWSSVKLAYEKAIERQGEIIERPKALGDIRGISYIYPMLYRFGIIEVPEKTAEKMRLRGGKQGGKRE